MSSLACIVLAAGDGTRMRSSQPKMLHPLCGRPMMDYVVELITALRCRPVVVVTGAGARAVQARLPRGWRAARQAVRRGTGHAVAVALRKIPRTVPQILILYGDHPLVRAETVRALIQAHHATRAACTILTAQVDNPQQYGHVLREGAFVARIVEDRDATPQERQLREVNVGVTLCQRRALAEALRHMTPANAQREYYLTDAMTWLAGQASFGGVRAYQTANAAEALGINTRQDLAEATSVLRQRTVAQLMAAGVTVVDPRTTYVELGVRIGRDTTLHPCTVIERDVVIGRRCSIGPFARIRHGVTLADDVRIGNFTEVVRSRVGARVRMNHGSYLGDATVGPDVNIGAGTITANYDGRAKHRTQIGARAFVGSGTVIVAPATVGARAVTGAGCVITRGTRVQSGAVVVGVPARTLKPSRERRRPR